MITTTMITSVFERTREIGITVAAGASENDVIRMVLYECLLIGIIGGIVGNIPGYLFTVVLNTVGQPSSSPIWYRSSAAFSETRSQNFHLKWWSQGYTLPPGQRTSIR